MLASEESKVVTIGLQNHAVAAAHLLSLAIHKTLTVVVPHPGKEMGMGKWRIHVGLQDSMFNEVGKRRI